MVTKKHLLTEQEKNFCIYYTITFDPADAHRKAGYKETPSKNHKYLADKLLREPHISDEIERLCSNERSGASATKAFCREYLRNMLNVDIRDLVDPDTGRILPPHRWSAKAANAISKFELKAFKPNDTTDAELLPQKIEVADKLVIIDKLLKLSGGYTENIQVTGAGGKDLNPGMTNAQLQEAIAAIVKHEKKDNDNPAE